MEMLTLSPNGVTIDCLALTLRHFAALDKVDFVLDSCLVDEMSEKMVKNVDQYFPKPGVMSGFSYNPKETPGYSLFFLMVGDEFR